MKTLFVSAFFLIAAPVYCLAYPGNGNNIEYGTFGGDGLSAPKLILNDDNTYHYIDKTDGKNPIDIIGTYYILDGEVILRDTNNKKVMNELQIVREGKCLKARKGAAFYTLCNCD